MLFLQLFLLGLISIISSYPLSSISRKLNKNKIFISTVEDFETEGIPKWAGKGPISYLANLLIKSPLFGPVKAAARQLIINTAIKNGVAWQENAKILQTNQNILNQYYEEIENKKIQYPFYYTQPFHAYDTGNLNWQAAYECESATYSMASRVYPGLGLEYLQAQLKLRNAIFDIITTYRNGKSPKSILDIGCSVGISTFYLADYFKNAQITGLDLSPYFLAVAKYRQTINSKYKNIKWIHGLAENMDMIPKNKFDLINLSFVCHELPDDAAIAIFQEAYRVASPGATIVMTDNNPKSKVIQNLPPAIFAMMKSTEPWSDQYYTFDVKSCLEQIGFKNVQSVPSDPRHRTIMATK